VGEILMNDEFYVGANVRIDANLSVTAKLVEIEEDKEGRQVSGTILWFDKDLHAQHIKKMPLCCLELVK
jgi:hypothetical protein